MTESQIVPARMPPPLPGALPAHWWDRNWKWFVPALGLSMMALLAGFVLALLWFVSTMLKSSEPYRHAVSVAREDARVVAALGTPIEAGFLPMGELITGGGSGSANLSIRLSGPQGSGHVYLRATRRAGVWRYEALSFVAKDSGTRIELPHEGPVQGEPVERCSPGLLADGSEGSGGRG